MKYSYYPGCTLRNKAKDLDRYARLCAEALGFTLEELETWQCCGGVYPLGTDEIASNCPMCNGDEIQRLRRVTGYLTGNYTTAFNEGKQEEVSMRVKHSGESL